jgi:glutamine amidotransferase PdxT
MGVMNALELKSSQEIDYIEVMKPSFELSTDSHEEKMDADEANPTIVLPGAVDGMNAQEVICAARNGNLVCTPAFHPEITDDLRRHEIEGLQIKYLVNF